MDDTVMEKEKVKRPCENASEDVPDKRQKIIEPEDKTSGDEVSKNMDKISPKSSEVSTNMDEISPESSEASDALGKSLLSGDQKHDIAQLKTEVDVGITEYISTHSGFTAIIKQRYSDFLVNEVDISGQIVRLTDIGAPTIDEEPEKEEEVVQEKPQNPDLLLVMTSEQVEELREVEKSHTGEVWIEVGDDKEMRTKVHSAIRENFTRLESSTQDRDGQKCIKVFSAGDNSRYNNKFRKDRPKQRKPAWPAGKPEYCQFVLYKENHDTANAVNHMGKALRINAGQFTYAGTKDFRAKSSQLMNVYRIPATRLHHLNKKFRGRLVLGNFTYTDKPLKLGMLSGNRFTIILRNVTGSDEQINQGVKTLTEVGFINYFGMQRFGTGIVPTHHVGRAIIQNKWAQVVDLIMQPRNDDIREARRVWAQTRDAKLALDAIGWRTCIEKHLLTGLAKSGRNDVVGALSYIPRNSRHMYLHSYQSYVWNTMVTTRIRKYGLKPTTGDLVLRHSDKNLTKNNDKDGDNDEDDQVEDEVCVERTKPEILTAETVNAYSIYDVVLPLPGFDIVLPENAMSEEYHTFLQKDDLVMGSFKHKVRDYAMPGGYRNILVKPADLNHEIMRYDDYTISLALSDYEKLEGESEAVKVAEGQMKAVKLELTLPRSTYATMAIREVLKCDTSAGQQTLMNEGGVLKSGL